MKTIYKFIFTSIILFSSSSCSNDCKSYLKKIEKETGIQKLTSGNVLFCYNDVTGFDSSGILYYVLDYKDQEYDFLKQFSDVTGSKLCLHSDKNDLFESKVNNLILKYFATEYEKFENKYKIDWSSENLFYYDSLDILTFSLVYYEEKSLLYLLKYEM